MEARVVDVQRPTSSLSIARNHMNDDGDGIVPWGFGRMVEGPTLEDAEQAVRARTTGRHQSVLDGLDQLFDRYVEGFGQIADFTLTEENETQFVLLRLLTKAFNSIQCAHNLLQLGYYTQALTLVRSAYEDWLVSHDCVSHAETVRALQGKGGRVPSFKIMADRMDAAFRADWTGAGGEGTYGLLSTFSHPRTRAVNAVINPDTKTLRVGPDYDESLFLFTAHHLLNISIRLTFFFAALTSPEWIKAVLAPAVEEAHQLREELHAQATRLLGNPP